MSENQRMATQTPEATYRIDVAELDTRRALPP